MIALSIGHYPAAPGACVGMYREHDVAREWVSEIAIQLRPYEPVFIPHIGRLEEKVVEINVQRNIVLACELHFNSDPLHAGKGCETLYCPRSMLSGLAARTVQLSLARVIAPDRGIKEGWYRMDKPGHVDYPGDLEGDEKVDYFLKATKCPAIIVEPEFIHNRLVIETLKQQACVAIAAGLHAAAKSIREQLGANK